MSDTSLKFPIIRKELSRPRPLSMDEYYAFVQFNLKYTFDKKAYAEWKKMLAVDAPFSIR